MTIAKKLDKVFKRLIPSDCRKDPKAYQELFAKVTEIICAMYDLVPWIPADKQQPDHLQDVLVWIEPTDRNPDGKPRFNIGWYDWKHDMWVIQNQRAGLFWEVTHWAYVHKEPNVK